MSALWFRWWNATTSDPKLALIARETQRPRSEVVAVWVAVLERANVGEDRGTADDLPADEIAITLDMDDADVEAILGAMRRRAMLDGDKVEAWPKRQPDREREDEDATERKRRQREREKAEQSHATSRHVTPCHATSRHVTPPDTDTDTDTDTEENHQGVTIDPAGAGSPPRPVEVGKADADHGDQGGQEGPAACPHEQIVEAYHAALPAAPKVRCWGDANRAQLRARWRERAERQSVAWWRAYFESVAESDFLCGRAIPAGGRQPFVADLAWLVRASNLEKVVNGRYLNRDHDGLSAAGRATAQAGERWAQKMRERMERDAGGADESAGR